MIRFVLFLLLAAVCLPRGPLAAAGGHTLLAVFAHPDDETAVGTLLAKLASEGHSVHLLTITSGQKGVQPHANIPAGEQLGKAREAELRCSARALGIRPPVMLGMQDQGIASAAEMDRIAAAIRRMIGDVRPDVVLTWGPDGATGHPDHRIAGAVTTQVFQQRSQLPHVPRKLYYLAFPESRFGKPGSESLPLKTVSDEFITTVIDGSKHTAALSSALACHATQWDEAARKRMEQMQIQLLGGEVHLRLVFGPGSVARAKETDVFAGIPGKE